MILYHFRVALASLWRERWINILCVLTLATGLFLMGAALALVYNVDRAVRTLPDRFAVIAYMAGDTTDARAREAMGAVKALGAVREARYISSAEALAEMRSVLKDSEYVLEGLSENPLPAAIQITLRPSALSRASVAALAADLGRIEGVTEVRYAASFLAAIETARKGADSFGLALTALLGGSVVFVSFSTVKILLYRRTQEIETMKLLGATRSFIRSPFVIEGALLGGIGGLLGGGALHLAAAFIHGPLALSVPLVKFIAIPAALALYAPLAGLAIGILGALVAIGRITF